MTTCTAKSIESSISEWNVRLDTFQLRYPLWFHAEILTHRIMSRNASSARAQPPEKVLDEVLRDMAEPFHWGLNKAGMQATNKLTIPGEIAGASALWREAGRYTEKRARELFTLFGLHKQVVNRLVAPWMHIDVIISSTDWENFFALRCHPDAEPACRALAWRIADVYYVTSKPKLVNVGEWHLPYVTDEERATLPLDVQKKCSTARCARVSFRNHDGTNPKVEKDIELYERLLAGLVKGDGEPGHLSPFEHQATPLTDPKAFSGNFRGWGQHRKEIPGEQASFDYQAAIERGWRDLALVDAPGGTTVL